nr:MAG: hypothetical protein [Podoviridae sp. ctka020]
MPPISADSPVTLGIVIALATLLTSGVSSVTALWVRLKNTEKKHAEDELRRDVRDREIKEEIEKLNAKIERLLDHLLKT